MGSAKDKQHEPAHRQKRAKMTVQQTKVQQQTNIALHRYKHFRYDGSLIFLVLRCLCSQS